MTATISVPTLVCRIMGAVLVIVAIWGFIDGDRVLIFHVNTAHNVVHLLSGVAALICGFSNARMATVFCLAFGAVYGLVAVLGLAGVQAVVDLLHLNEADNWLHVAIAAVFLVAGVIGLSATAPVRSAPSPRA